MSKFYKQASQNPAHIELMRSKVEERGDRFDENMLVTCPKCHAFFHPGKKSWRHSTDWLTEEEARAAEVKQKLCPADKMIADKLFEGELAVKDIPRQFKEELVNLIHNFGKRAYDRDCQHKIIAVHEEGDSIIVTTTENQLAVRLGKKIKDVFDTVDLNISHADEPYQVARVSVAFKN